jgi:hypothetical protein
MKNTKKASHLLTYCSLLTAAVVCGCASDKAEPNAKPAPVARETPQANAGYKGGQALVQPLAAGETAQANAGYKSREYAANPSKIKFGEFKSMELKEIELNPQENVPGNRKSAKVIDEMLVVGLKGIWPDLKVIPKGVEFSKSGDRTLQVSPRIDHIRIVSPGGRLWFGAMAGGSDLVMHVDYRDSSTGAIIANPDFWKGNNAWSGGWSGGATDNRIRDKVVEQIVSYTAGNK